MSDEPKGRSRAWGWWLAFALLVLYPLSAGPVAWLYNARLIGTPAGDSFYRACGVVYYPLGWLTQHSDWAMDVATNTTIGGSATKTPCQSAKTVIPMVDGTNRGLADQPMPRAIRITSVAS
jgi:hypothetical protein